MKGEAWGGPLLFSSVGFFVYRCRMYEKDEEEELRGGKSRPFRVVTGRWPCLSLGAWRGWGGGGRKKGCVCACLVC